MGTAASGATTGTATGLSQAATYSFEIQATHGGTTSAAAGPITGTTLPAAASNLATTAVTASSVGLSWTDNSAGLGASVIERSTDNFVTFTNVATVSLFSTYTDTTVTEGTAYSYRIVAQTRVARRRRRTR